LILWSVAAFAEDGPGYLNFEDWLDDPFGEGHHSSLQPPQNLPLDLEYHYDPSEPLGTVDQWNQTPYTNPVIEVLPLDLFYGNQATHTREFKFTAIFFRDSGWTRDILIKRIRKLARVYAQCRIRMNPIHLIKVDAPDGILDFEHDGRGFVNRKVTKTYYAKFLPQIYRPAQLFIRSFTNGTTGTSARDEWAKGTVLTNLTWVSFKTQSPEYIAKRHPRYVVEAHEVGHLLTNSGHTYSNEPNIMNAKGGDLRTDRFNRQQCRDQLAHRLTYRVSH